MRTTPLVSAALLAFAIASAPTAAHAATEGLPETLTVGANGSATGQAKLKAGTDYTLDVSGTMDVATTGSGGTTTSRSLDAFYCFAGTSGNCATPFGDNSLSLRSSGDDAILRGYFLAAFSKPRGFEPAYSASHVYTATITPFRDGALTASTQLACGLPGVSCSGPGYSLRISDAGGCGASKATRAAVNEVRAVAVQPGVQVHKVGTPEDQWCDLEKDQVLQQGDEISCDPDGAATLQFADNSTVVVKHTTQLKIASFFTEGGVVKTEILLKMGEVAAKVHKSEATKSDFRIKSGKDHTGSVRGTDFSAFYDPGSGLSLWTVREGTVAVAPGANASERLVNAGQEALISRSGKVAVARPGKAGARGGVGPKAALERVSKLIGKASGRCAITTPRDNAFSVKPAPGGWKVGVKVEGKLKGTSAWTVRGSKTTPGNALARKLKAGCR